jgi:hypothetical protein
MFVVNTRKKRKNRKHYNSNRAFYLKKKKQKNHSKNWIALFVRWCISTWDTCEKRLIKMWRFQKSRSSSISYVCFIDVMSSYVNIWIINVFVLIKFIILINNDLNIFVRIYILSETKRVNDIKVKANDIYLISKWSDVNESIMLSTSAEKVHTYDDLMCYLDQKDKKSKLWIIFEVIDETIDVFANVNFESSYEYDDFVDKVDSFVKKIVASFQKKDKEKTIAKIKTK